MAASLTMALRRLAGPLRGLATAAKPPAAPPAPPVDMMAQLPLKLFGLPGRYASALYVAASKASALKEACSSL